MAFLDVSFPRGVAAGVAGGPERRVDIVALASGAEERNERWRSSRRTYQAGLGIRDADDLAAVIALFEEARGPLHSFRFRDWTDFWSGASSKTPPTAMDQVIGTGDGTRTTFQLQKTYGTLNPYTREITKPVAGSVKISRNGTVLASGWSVNNLTGVVTFVTPPPSGHIVRAGFLFDVPVRFDAQSLSVDLSFFSEGEGRGLGTIPEIPLIEVRE